MLTLPKGPTLIKPLWNLLSSVARWPMQLHADCWFAFRLHTLVNVELLTSCLHGCKFKHTSHSSNGGILHSFFFPLDVLLTVQIFSTLWMNTCCWNLVTFCTLLCISSVLLSVQEDVPRSASGPEEVLPGFNQSPRADGWSLIKAECEVEPQSSITCWELNCRTQSFLKICLQSEKITLMLWGKSLIASTFPVATE